MAVNYLTGHPVCAVMTELGIQYASRFSRDSPGFQAVPASQPKSLGYALSQPA